MKWSKDKLEFVGRENKIHIYNRCIMCRSPIVFFVEDTRKEGEYEFLFKSIFTTLDNNFKVFSMDGKQGVIEIYQYIKKASVKREKYFYLVDGDFDILQNNYSEICGSYGNNFCFLERYDIENYLIDYRQVDNYLRINCNATNDVLLNSINYNEWENRTKVFFGELFLLFFVVSQIKDKFVNCRTPETVGKYIDLSLDEDGMPSDKTVSKCKNSIIGEFFDINTGVDNSGFENWFRIKKKELSKMFHLKTFHNISGKYLLHSLEKYIRSIKCKCSDNEVSNLKRKINGDELRRFLILSIDPNKFEFLFNKWNKAIQNLLQ